jgi:hypothetical protein
VRITRRPSPARTCAKAKGNFLSLSQIRNLACDPGAWIPAKVQRLLADSFLIRIGGD